MNKLAAIEGSLRSARVHTEGDRLFVDTGRIRRVWQWTGSGFATREVGDSVAVRGRIGASCACDWELPDGRELPRAELPTLTLDRGTDEGFTSEHLCLTADMAYPAAGLVLRWVVWVYPGAPGIRTQLAAKATGSAHLPPSRPVQGPPFDGRVDRIPHGGPAVRRRYFGYFNATQQRNETHLDILKEEVVGQPLMFREWCNWASAACVEDDGGGVALVKESHKCVNQDGHVSGGFVCDEAEGLSCTGWGLRLDEISSTAFTPGWATWCLAWSGADLERETAFKAFDRVRFPSDPERDLYLQANTWGSTESGEDARRAAGEESVLRELETCAELGIDVLQIDDGWQVPPGHCTWTPGEAGWHPHPESYPEGWGPVRRRAAELGVKLGLWAAAQPITLEELQANHEAGGFQQYKLDFAVLKTRREIDALMRKVRAFVLWTGHRVRVNWDVTENPARYGYFFAREYGSIYLENRKPVRPPGVVYRPHTVLRDLWQVAKYLDLHRFQCSIQNVDRVDRERSDAHLHPHAYAAAIALMGIPLFFQETKFYSEAARAELKPLLAVYRTHREAMFRGIVHPIGAKPDNARWTGFQSHIAEQGRGYLTIFRERCNAEQTQRLGLVGLSRGELVLEDLVDGTRRTAGVGDDGRVEFRIPAAPGFLFLSYRV